MSKRNNQNEENPTQAQIIENYLMTGASVTHLEACYPLGVEIYKNAGVYGHGWYITDLAGCIKVLRKAGADILSVWKTNPLTGARYVSYRYSAEYLQRKRREKMQPVQLKMF